MDSEVILFVEHDEAVEVSDKAHCGACVAEVTDTAHCGACVAERPTEVTDTAHCDGCRS